ncbi:MAG: ATP-binding cassette domain-containing protein [Chloroflexi bacterium]|nr:MAG: ATP-binding cassette domain-containing protein [Chloroflexota bacterium]TME18955.1 MAG: ATP-binding cassette domain-containing protein [Chloroflexota bacterium]
MDCLIEVKDLVKRYRKASINAVDGVSFDVRAGEFFALLGPNGAGKTTTISILTTTLTPTAGVVKIAGYDARREAAQVRRQVGIIFQTPSLDLNLSGEENIRFHAILYGLYPYRPAYRLMPGEYRRQVLELAGVLGMAEEVFRPVKKLSGGMKRKLEIIRGLLHRPRILFLDEPTAGLDAASRRNLWEYLRRVRAEYDVTILLTTHNLDEAEQADRICILDHGKVVALGTPAEVKSQLLEEHLILDAADRDQLRTELRQLEVDFQETGHFEVHLKGRSAQQVLRGLKTELTVLRTHSPTLEDAYLRILAGE